MCERGEVDRPEPNKQGQLLRPSGRTPDDVATLLDPFHYVASANYVVPMLVHLPIKGGNTIVDNVPVV